MLSIPQRRQVLILADDQSIRNLFLLMKELASVKAVEGSVSTAAAIMDREKYEAIILDLRCSGSRSTGAPGSITRVQHSITDRVLQVSAEADNPETLDVVERYLLSRLPGGLLWFGGRHHHRMRLRAVL